MNAQGSSIPNSLDTGAPRNLSANLSIQEVLARLCASPVIEGLLLVGSAATDQLGHESDYDLVIVLAPGAPRIQNGITYVDHRLTDLMFFSVHEVEEFLALSSPVSADARLGGLIRWFQQGTMLFDRSGLLARAQEKAQGVGWLLGPGDLDAYHAWSSINYNLRHNRRMLRSDDPVYHRALAVRMLYCLHDVLMGYFRVRGIANEGEKRMIRYLEVHDPAFLAHFEATVSEPAMTRRVALYDELAAMALAPMGGLWEGEVTVMNARESEDWQADVSEAMALWHDVLDSVVVHAREPARPDGADGSGENAT